MMALDLRLAARRDVEKIKMHSRWHPAAEKRHQRPAQRVRPSGSENHFGAGMVGFAAGGLKQIRNPAGNRGRGIAASLDGIKR